MSTTSQPYGGGYQCGCGTWVPTGYTHYCSFGATSSAPYTSDLGRIASALERIARYYESIGLPEVAKEENDALVALDALLADNERLKKDAKSWRAHRRGLARAALAPEQEQP